MDQRRNRAWKTLGRGLAASSAALLLAGCGGGSSSSTPAASGGNHAPQISGSPTETIQGGTAYAFYPSALDADGNPLTFQISSKPAWASFDAASGALTGTPPSTQAGSYANILISVSDGMATAALEPFTIAVTQVSTGAATISWLPPTQNNDNTALVNLAGYRIYYGTSAAAPSQAVDIPNVGITTYMLQDLLPGTWYFAVRAYTTTGSESDSSNIASKTIE